MSNTNTNMNITTTATPTPFTLTTDQQQQLIEQFASFLQVGGNPFTFQAESKDAVDDVNMSDIETPTPTPSVQEKPFENAQVNGIRNHRIDVNGNWSFLIEWVNDLIYTWVNDSDCNCEKKISEYLNSVNLNTVYIICRVSTKLQGGNLDNDYCSLKDQESELLAVASRYPTARKKVIHITGSAYKSVPKDMIYFGDASHSGDKIMIYRCDRLSRNVIKYMTYLDQLHEKGVQIYSVNEQIWFHEKKLVFVQHILDAHKESHAISQRVLLSVKRRRDRGDEQIGSLPWGKKYFRTESGRLIVVQDDQAKIIYNKLCSELEKCSSDNVAKTLNDLGYAKKGRKWNARMVDSTRRNQSLNFK